MFLDQVPSENETDELTKQLDNKWINTYGMSSSMLKAKDESPASNSNLQFEV